MLIGGTEYFNSPIPSLLEGGEVECWFVCVEGEVGVLVVEVVRGGEVGGEEGGGGGGGTLEGWRRVWRRVEKGR